MTSIPSDDRERPNGLLDELYATQSVLAGADAYRLFERVQPEVVHLVRDILQETHRLYLGERAADFIVRSFESIERLIDDEAALEVAFRERRVSFRELELGAARTAYKKGSLHRTARLLDVRSLGERIVDVGAGDNGLGNVILSLAPSTTTVVGIDVLPDDGSVISRAGLSFIRQAAQDALPVTNRYADCTLLRYSLHHMTHDVQRAVLDEAKRITVPGGKIVLVEDSYSYDRPALVQNVFYNRLLELGEADLKLTLALLDASSSLVTEERMPFAFTFRSIEEWIGLLSGLGLEDVEVDYWGMPLFSLYQAPMAIISSVCPG